jgi:membrane fusion protein (multidrug efflux system)
MLDAPSNILFRQSVNAIAIALLALSLAACKPKNEAPGGHGGMGAMPPPEVATVTVQPQTVPVKLEYTGQIVGVRDIEVRARVTGILLKRNYVEGSPVKAGQSLFTIDPAPFQAALARAEADMASAEARLAKAARDSARLKPLIEAHAISQKDFDDALSAEQIAAAEVQSAKTRITDARLNVSYTRVEAPISGIAGRVQVTEGSLISGPDVLLTTVTQVAPIYASFGVSDNERLKLDNDAKSGRLVLPKDGMFDVTVKLADGSTYAKQGKMNFSDFRISTTTGTSDARAELPNPDGALRPGQFVRVALTGAQRVDAILVPQRAVLEGPQGKFVFVANAESKVEIHPVEVGDWTGDSWVINKGLQAGDRVIVDGVVKIGPGAPVKTVDANAPKTASVTTPEAGKAQTGKAQK